MTVSNFIPVKVKDKILFGRKPVLEVLQRGESLEKLFLHNNLSPTLRAEFLALAKQQDIQVQFVPKVKLDKLVRGNHQGVVALGGLIRYAEVEAVVAHIFDQGRDPVVAVLDGITDVRNFGAIARAAEVLGIDALVIGMQNSAPVNAFAIKASAGALTRIPVCRSKHLGKTLESLKALGLQVAVSSVENATPIDTVELTGPLACLLGAEDTGVNPNLVEDSDIWFTIPQQGDTDSLNVSVAAGIIFYEIQRQRKTLSARGR